MPAAPSCPRCAYDLSGETATWERQCPLAGRCSECGLDFEWAHIVSDILRPPTWSFEHALTLWAFRIPRAHCASLFAGKFWRTIRLEHPVRPMRLVGSVLAIFTLLHFFCATIAMLGAAHSPSAWLSTWHARRFSGGSALLEVAWNDYRHYLMTTLVVSGSADGRLWRGPFAVTWLASLGAIVIAMPAAMLLLPQTFRQAKLRRAHLLRGFAYTLPGVAAFAAAGALLAVLVNGDAGPAPGWFVAIPGLIWVVHAWRRIIADYLRLPRPGAIWIATAIIGLLAAALATVWLLPGEMHFYLRSFRLR